MIRLSKSQILLIHDQLISETGGSSGLRDEGMLDSALNAPFQTFGGEDVYPSMQKKAARLCFGLVKNHPFVDGNKRIGAHAMLVFLALNGIELQHTQSELSDVILQLAAGEIEATDLLRWILAHQVYKLSSTGWLFPCHLSPRSAWILEWQEWQRDIRFASLWSPPSARGLM